MKDKYFIPEEVIVMATEGDEIAIKTILSVYQGYIYKLSQSKEFDSEGNYRIVIDSELKGTLETQLMLAILKFKIR